MVPDDHPDDYRDNHDYRDYHRNSDEPRFSTVFPWRARSVTAQFGENSPFCTVPVGSGLGNDYRTGFSSIAASSSVRLRPSCSQIGRIAVFEQNCPFAAVHLAPIGIVASRFIAFRHALGGAVICHASKPPRFRLRTETGCGDTERDLRKGIWPQGMDEGMG